jgi:hypothetical protein
MGLGITLFSTPSALTFLIADCFCGKKYSRSQDVFSRCQSYTMSPPRADMHALLQREAKFGGGARWWSRAVEAIDQRGVVG